MVMLLGIFLSTPPWLGPLLKKEVNDIVAVKTPNGISEWCINSIEYIRQWLN